MSERLLEELKKLREPVTYAALKSKLMKNGMKLRLQEARRMFAATLREAGITSELVDLL